MGGTCRCTMRTRTCASRRAIRFRVVDERAEIVHVEGGTAGADDKTGHKRHQEHNRPKFVAKWRHQLGATHL